MFERFSPEGIRVIIFAQEEARQYWHSHLEQEDLLLGLLKSQSNSLHLKWYHGLTETAASKSLTSLGISLDTVRASVKPGKPGTFIDIEIPFSPAVKTTLQNALQIADSHNDQVVKTHHLVLALLQDTEGPLRHVMNLRTIEVADLEAELTRLLDSGEYVEERIGELPPMPTASVGHSIKLFLLRKLYAWRRRNQP